MKHRHDLALLSGAALAGLLLLAPPALAQDTTAPPAFAGPDGGAVAASAEASGVPERLRPRMQDRMGRASAGGDAARLARAERLVDRLDADSDGLLSPAELAAGMERWAALRDGDPRAQVRGPGRNRAAADEAAPGKRWGGMRQGPDGRRGAAGAERPRGPGLARLGFDAIDTDGDGVISRAEFEAALARQAGPRARGAAPAVPEPAPGAD